MPTGSIESIYVNICCELDVFVRNQPSVGWPFGRDVNTLAIDHLLNHRWPREIYVTVFIFLLCNTQTTTTKLQKLSRFIRFLFWCFHFFFDETAKERRHKCARMVRYTQHTYTHIYIYSGKPFNPARSSYLFVFVLHSAISLQAHVLMWSNLHHVYSTAAATITLKCYSSNPNDK